MCPSNVLALLFITFSIVIIIQVFKNRQKMVACLNLRTDNRGKNVVMVGDRPVGFHFFEGSRNSPSRLVLSYKGEFNSYCVIRREGASDKIFKSVGLNKETQVFDPELESKYYFECEDDNFVRTLMAKPEVKELLRVIFDENSFSEIKIEGMLCSFSKTPVDLTEYSAEQLQLLAGKLVELTGFLPPMTTWGVSATPKTKSFVAERKIWDGLSVGLFIAGAFLALVGIKAYHPVFPGKLFLNSLWFSIPVAVALLFLAYNQLSGHATTAQSLLKLIFAGVPGLVICAWVGMLVINGYFDSSLPIIRHVYVVDKSISHSRKHGDTYHLTLSEWEKGQMPFSFQVGSYDYRRIPMRTPCKVETKNGFLGYQWIGRCRCDPGVVAAKSRQN